MKTCFVISPISDKGSPIREEADNLLWIINQAAKPHGFDVVRIDEITRSLEITREIIRQIRESDLCIIILTGNNPNVFYEAGRRHETDKPYIHLLKEGEKLPFDVAAINTIHYEGVDTLGGAQSLVSSIDDFIQSMASALDEKADGEITLSAIADGIQRINAKIDRLGRDGRPTAGSMGGASLEDPILGLHNPREAFLVAIAAGDIDKAASLIPRLHSLLGDSKEYVNAMLMVLQGGQSTYLGSVIDLLREPPETIDIDDRKNMISACVNCYILTGGEAEGIVTLSPIIDQLLSELKSDADRAVVLNQKQKLLYSSGQYEGALAIAESVLDLNSGERAYYYNASLIHEQLNNLIGAERMIDKVLEFEDPDADHLSQAIDVYLARGKNDQAKEALTQLRDKYPQRASIVLLKKEARDLLQS